MHDLAAKYGDVFSIKLGSRMTIVLSSRDAIYDAYIKKAKLFAGRPDFVTFAKTNHGAIGLSLCDYSETYADNRKNTMRGIHRLCENKQVLDDILCEDVQKMTSLFDKLANENKEFGPMEEFKKIVPGMFLSIMFGSRFSYDDPEFLDIVNWFNTWFENAEADNPPDFFSILQYLPNKRLDNISDCGKAFEQFATKMIKEFNKKEGDTGLIYSFFRFFGDYSELPHQERLNFSRVVADLCGGGFDTVASTMGWAPLYLLEKPHVLRKCREEIHAVFGDGTLSTEKKGSVPYFCATLYDIFRHSSVGPLGLPRCTTEDTSYKTYRIPKGTMIFANLWGCNHNPMDWKETEFLYPENFLTDDGMFDREAERKLMTFSAGVRKCPGEKLAFNKSFMILGTMIQKYNFTIEKPPQDMLPKTGLTLKPKFYTMKLTHVSK